MAVCAPHRVARPWSGAAGPAHPARHRHLGTFLPCCRTVRLCTAANSCKDAYRRPVGLARYGAPATDTVPARRAPTPCLHCTRNSARPLVYLLRTPWTPRLGTPVLGPECLPPTTHPPIPRAQGCGRLLLHLDSVTLESSSFPPPPTSLAPNHRNTTCLIAPAGPKSNDSKIHSLASTGHDIRLPRRLAPFLSVLNPSILNPSTAAVAVAVAAIVTGTVTLAASPVD